MMANFIVDFDHDLRVKNWRTYEDNLKHKQFTHQILSFAETEKLLQDNPEIVVEMLGLFSHILKMRVAENPDDTVTMTYRKQNENGTYLLKEAVDFDLIQGVDIITQQLAKQYNYVPEVRPRFY